MQPTTKNELKFIPIELIKPNSFNPQNQDEETFNLLVDDVLENGVISAIEVIPCDDDTYMILGGEHRWRAARATGETEMPCLVLMDKKFKESDIQKLTTIRLNTLKGNLDPTKFIKMYTDMAVKYTPHILQRLMGFSSEKEFKKVFNNVKKNISSALPHELRLSSEEKLKEVKNLKELSNVVQELFQNGGKTLEDNGFMILKHGAENSIFIKMNEDLKATMDRVMIYCKANNKNISELLNPILKDNLTKIV